jgi:hypothetical protein
MAVYELDGYFGHGCNVCPLKPGSKFAHSQGGAFENGQEEQQIITITIIIITIIIRSSALYPEASVTKLFFDVIRPVST